MKITKKLSKKITKRIYKTNKMKKMILLKHFVEVVNSIRNCFFHKKIFINGNFIFITFAHKNTLTINIP